MKRVPLRDRAPFVAREVIIGMLEAPPAGQHLMYADMRKRDRVLDIMEALPAGERFVDLEDADHALLRQVLDTAAFGTGKRELRRILDDIVNAKSPEDTPDLKVVGN